MSFPTPAQARAVGLAGRPVCVVAGAGSGKTSVLAERFVDLVLARGVPVERVLTVTFTEKAAVEMRERVAARFLARGRPDLRRAVETAWVGTIHSFCSRLLRENAVEAAVDPSFGVLSEAEAARLREGARDAVLAAMTAAEPNALLALSRIAAEDFGAEADAALLACRGIDRPIRDLFAEEAKPPLTSTAEGELHRALEGLREGLPSFRGAGAGKAKGVLEAAREAEDAPLEERAARVLHAVDLRCGSPAKERLAEVRAAGEALREVLAGVRAAPAAAALADFLERLDGEYGERKRARGALDFADLERRALDLLRGDPAVAEALRARFDQVLVDEYQDTNPVQEALLGLVARPEGLFVVGDPKQAIYGFRGADHRGFARARETAGEEGTVLLRENFRSREEILRFANAALAPAFAAGGAAQVPWEPLACGGLHDPKAAPSVEIHLLRGETVAAARPAEARLVARRLRELVAGGGASITARREDSGPARAGGALRWSDAAILLRATTEVKEYERALVDEDVPYLVVKGRGFYEAREVVDLANLLAAAENPRDEVALAAALRSPAVGLDDDALLALALERRRRGRGTLFHDVVVDPSRVRGLGRESRRRLERFLPVLERMRALRGRGRLAEVVDLAARGTGYDLAVLLQPNGRQRAANLRKVREEARAFEEAGAGGLAEFTAHVRRVRLREERVTEAPLGAEDADAVAVLTVHQAKGLEWPVVVIPDLGRSAPTGRPSILVQTEGAAIAIRGEEGRVPTPGWRRLDAAVAEREAAEAVRLLHVAVTRAREHLLLTAPLAPRARGPWLGIVLAAVGGEEALPSAPGETTAAVDGAPVLVRTRDAAEEGGPAAGRRRSIFRERRGRFLAGRGPGVRVTREVRAAAAEEVAALPGPPPAADDSVYLATVSALLDFEACPLRYRLRYRLGVPDGHPEPGPGLPDRGRQVLAGDEDEVPGEGAPHEAGLPARLLGIAAHEVLGTLDLADPAPRAIRMRVQERLREVAGREPPAESVGTVAGWITKFLGMDFGHALQAAPRDAVLREVPFLLKEQEVLVRGQVDVLLRGRSGRWTVADYKAGRRDPATEARYRRQVQIYARAAHAATGLLPERGLLVYLPSRDEVPVDLSPAAMEEVAALLRRFAERTREGRYDPRRAHCPSCPYGPGGTALCPVGRAEARSVG